MIERAESRGISGGVTVVDTRGSTESPGLRVRVKGYRCRIVSNAPGQESFAAWRSRRRLEVLTELAGEAHRDLVPRMMDRSVRSRPKRRLSDRPMDDGAGYRIAREELRRRWRPIHTFVAPSGPRASDGHRPRAAAAERAPAPSWHSSRDVKVLTVESGTARRGSVAPGFVRRSTTPRSWTSPRHQPRTKAGKGPDPAAGRDLRWHVPGLNVAGALQLAREIGRAHGVTVGDTA